MSSKTILFALLTIKITTLIFVADCSSSTVNQIKAKINTHHLINTLHNQIKAKEEEMRNAETINRNFERMIQLVNILGQVDNFLTERTKAVIKKLALLVDDENGNGRRFRDSDENDVD